MNDFKNALILAKGEMTIDLIARTINNELSAAESRELISRLYATMPEEQEVIL